MDQAQLDYEEKRLILVYDKLCKELENRQNDLDGFRKSMMATRRSIWENSAHTWEAGDTDAAANIKQYVDGLKQDTQMHQQASSQVIKLKRLKDSPYFGRFDFIEEGLDNSEKIYIGIQSFFDDNGDILIYDWRAPISGIFYDYELGPASYLCPDGVIKGKVHLKRQYRITGPKIDYMFENGVKIDDEILQQILGKNVDEKMRNIVNTIQKEQNQIIRDETHQVLMVQGSAGSGKTSIALHRIAYLLYKYRDQNMTAGNVLIFSPNTVFSDYISNVLPELGEENMHQTTFFEYMEKRVESHMIVEDNSNHMEYLLSPANDNKIQSARLKGVMYKSSLDFLGLLNEYASYLEEKVLQLEDIYFDNRVLITREEILSLMNKDYSYLPLVRRIRKTKDRLYYLIKPFWQARLKEIVQELVKDPVYKKKAREYGRLKIYREFKPVREKIRNMLDFSVWDAYCNLFGDTDLFSTVAGVNRPKAYLEICKETYGRLVQHNMGYEDVSGYVYFKGILEGVPKMDQIRHVVIDEAQDYTPVQYAVFKQLFPKTRMTLLGDFNQAIHPYKEEFSYDNVRDILIPDSHVQLNLTKSYRSTVEIVEFTRSILGDKLQIEAIQREGDKPLVCGVDNEEALLNRMVEDIKDMVKINNMESVGVICKTALQSQLLYERIGKQMNAIMVTKDDRAFSKGIVILPVYLAKGLEFDAVVVYQANEVNYGREGDRRLLYTACTRALHKLNLYYTGKVSPLLTIG